MFRLSTVMGRILAARAEAGTSATTRLSSPEFPVAGTGAIRFITRAVAPLGRRAQVAVRAPAKSITHSERCRSAIPAKAITRGVTPLGRSTSPSSGSWSSRPSAS
jgi:hypothetical protein